MNIEDSLKQGIDAYTRPKARQCAKPAFCADSEPIFFLKRGRICTHCPSCGKHPYGGH